MTECIPCRRLETRKALFVLATLHARGMAGPVKLRNISAQGALIEGTNLPPPGVGFELVRGGLRIVGEVVWRDGGKAGLRFSEPTDTALWLPSGSSGQQQVDDTFQRLKAQAPVEVRNDPPSARRHSSSISGADLLRAAVAIDELSDALADDAGALARYGGKLQSLDIAAQLLRRLAEDS